MSLNSRSKYFCFTLNNYTAEDESRLASLDCSYVIYGREVGEGGTPHLQGYVEFASRLRGAQVKALVSSRCHIEKRRGTGVQASDYCKKDGDFVERGSLSKVKQGSRKDLMLVKEAIDSGCSMSEIADDHFTSWVKYRKSFESYKFLKSPPIFRNADVFCLWGEPGTGKTRFVYENEHDLYICSDPSLKWFDGYGGEEAVLIDDYNGEATTSFLLRVLDKYPLMVPVKGGFIPWNPLRIYVTSNIPPPFGHLTHSAAIRRRFRRVMHLENPLHFDDDGEVAHFKERLWS